MFKFNIPPQIGLKLNIAAFVKVFVLAAFLVAAVQTPADARNMKNLQIHNQTGYAFKALYLVPASSPHWGDDQLTMLGFNTLGNKRYITLSYNADISQWKMRIVFNNGTTRQWSGNNTVNLSGAWKLTIMSLGKNSKGVENFRWQKN